MQQCLNLPGRLPQLVSRVCNYGRYLVNLHIEEWKKFRKQRKNSESVLFQMAFEQVIEVLYNLNIIIDNALFNNKLEAWKRVVDPGSNPPNH